MGSVSTGSSQKKLLSFKKIVSRSDIIFFVDSICYSALTGYCYKRSAVLLLLTGHLNKIHFRLYSASH